MPEIKYINIRSSAAVADKPRDASMQNAMACMLLR